MFAILPTQTHSIEIQLSISIFCRYIWFLLSIAGTIIILKKSLILWHSLFWEDCAIQCRCRCSQSMCSYTNYKNKMKCARLKLQFKEVHVSAERNESASREEWRRTWAIYISHECIATSKCAVQASCFEHSPLASLISIGATAPDLLSSRRHCEQALHIHWTTRVSCIYYWAF